jgi:hypothetical protein
MPFQGYCPAYPEFDCRVLSGTETACPSQSLSNSTTKSWIRPSAIITRPLPDAAQDFWAFRRRALRKWLSTANTKDGAVFRAVDRHGRVASTGLHRDSIAAIFKTAASRAGMNATNIAGHSVRAGLDAGGTERLLRTRYRQNYTPPFTSCLAALHSAG